MTNNQSPDMPEEIYGNYFSLIKPFGGNYYRTEKEAGGGAVKYIRADLIKPEPVADKQSVLEQVELAISLIRQDKYDDCELSLTTMRCMLEQVITKPQLVADLEALKLEVRKAWYEKDWPTDGECYSDDVVQYLAAQGHLRPAVPREVIEKVIASLYSIKEAMKKSGWGHTDIQTAYQDEAYFEIHETIALLKPYVEGNQ